MCSGTFRAFDDRACVVFIMGDRLFEGERPTFPGFAAAQVTYG